MAELKVSIYNEVGKRNMIHAKDISEESVDHMVHRFFDQLEASYVATDVEREISEGLMMLKEKGQGEEELKEEPQPTPEKVTPKDYSDLDKRVEEAAKAEAPQNDVEIPTDIQGTSMAEAFQKSAAKDIVSEKKEKQKARKEVDKQPEYFHTGIREIDGEKRYKCHYWCQNPSCRKDVNSRSEGNTYIPEHRKVVFCHSCDTPHRVETATIDGFPERDSFGNFFIAEEIIEDHEER